MIQSSQQPASKAKSTETDIALPVSQGSNRPSQPAATEARATKDAGRVHIGGGMMHF